MIWWGVRMQQGGDDAHPQRSEPGPVHLPFTPGREAVVVQAGELSETGKPQQKSGIEGGARSTGVCIRYELTRNGGGGDAIRRRFFRRCRCIGRHRRVTRFLGRAGIAIRRTLGANVRGILHRIREVTDGRHAQREYEENGQQSAHCFWGRDYSFWIREYNRPTRLRIFSTTA